AWSYGNLFLAVSLVAFGVSFKKMFSQVNKYASDPLTEEYRLLFTAAIVIFLLALTLIDYGTDDELANQNLIANELLYLGMAGVIMAVGLFVTGLTATQFTAVIAIMMVALVVFNISQSVSSEEPPTHSL
ncbi:MAG: hypothetical protein AAF485_06880, partial [Chloroflexota bacterium]